MNEVVVPVIEFSHDVRGPGHLKACLEFSGIKSKNARHPADWPLPHERAHQDALWFCSGGDQLL